MKVVILFGGKSTEYEVSCMSAASVIKYIKNHEIIKIGITKDGKWYKTNADYNSIDSGDWVNLSDNCPVMLSLTEKAFIYDNEVLYPDIVFPVLHGKNGEDGTIQGLLEIAGIPYVGCRVLSSALCMDKVYAKAVCAQAGIKQLPYIFINRSDYIKNREAFVNKAEASLTYPIFVKPSNAGSSIGISKCEARSELIPAIDKAFKHDRRVLLETGVIDPDEVEVSVLGNDDPVASVSGRIIPSNDFYDYEAKYISNQSELKIPSGSEAEEEIRKIAVEAYKACDCRGLARVDFLLDKNGGIYLNELNTIPGFTSISMYSKLFDASGIGYPELINKLIGFGLEFND